MAYNRDKAVKYAHVWAYRRNPQYMDFSKMGGDCTNFISQCLYAGGLPMNYTKDTGWYYISANRRAAAWTGVEFLYNFLIRNKGIGPRGVETEIENIKIGDVVQLSFDGIRFAHSLFVVKAPSNPTPENVLIATHTYDSDNRALSTYNVKKRRYIHIKDV